jgi:peptidoglycan-associated lipoprotein
MNSRQILRAALFVAAPLALQACATKGYVREHIATAQLQSDSALNVAISTERAARTQGDSDNAARITALRSDLDSMRVQFNAKIAVVEDGIRFIVPVTFGYDDANVPDKDKAVLERFAKVSQKYYPGSQITVEGFADPAGSTKYNLGLSKRRADNVGQQLATLGVPQGQLRTIGYGESRLITPGAKKDDPGAEKNRRVVFVIETGAAEAATVASLP